MIDIHLQNIQVKQNTVIFSAAPEDFVSVSTLLTFSEVVTRGVVPVAIVDDNNSESMEKFIANVTLVDTDLEIETTPGQTTVSITDNDGERNRISIRWSFFNGTTKWGII